MKKLMKAIAFATVMCMLLSVSAFAADSVDPAAPVPTLGQDYNFTVSISGAPASEQVALLVVKHNAVLNDLKDGDILYIDQKEGTETFSVSLVKENVTDAKVDIYAGYASAGGAVAFKDDFVVTNVQELSIVLTDGVHKIPDVKATKEFEAVADQFAKLTDIGALAYATVQFNNLGGESVNMIGWEFINSETEKRYIDYELEGFEAIADGSPVQFGVAFTNGSTVAEQNRPQFVDGNTEVNVWFQVGTREGMKATK